MMDNIKKAIQVYNRCVARNTSIVFILIIYFLSKFFFDFRIKEDTYLVFLTFVIAVIIGIFIDYIIFRLKNRLNEFSSQEKLYIKYAYFLLAIILILGGAIILLTLNLIF